MSFTIKCDKCGSEQTFKDYNSKWDKIEITVNESCVGYTGEMIIIDVSLWCENEKCNHTIDIKY